MSEYPGTFEMRPQYDGRRSFYGKAMIERWDTANGMIYVPKPYGTTVATVTPTSAWGVTPETYEVKAAMGLLSATTLRLHKRAGRPELSKRYAQIKANIAE